MKKHINLLYDATIFANSYIKGSSYRTGIFFAAYNILKYFADYPGFLITLYVHDSQHNIKYFKKDILLSRFPVCINSKETPVFNINVHKRNIKATGNVIKKIIYFLKILKNYLFMFIYYRNNSSLLKTIDVFFSPMCPVITELNSYLNIKHFIVLHDMIPIIFYKDSINIDNDRFNIIIKSLNKNSYYLYKILQVSYHIK